MWRSVRQTAMARKWEDDSSPLKWYISSFCFDFFLSLFFAHFHSFFLAYRPSSFRGSSWTNKCVLSQIKHFVHCDYFLFWRINADFKYFKTGFSTAWAQKWNSSHENILNLKGVRRPLEEKQMLPMVMKRVWTKPALPAESIYFLSRLLTLWHHVVCFHLPAA